MEIVIRDTAHAAWVEETNAQLEYAHGEVRAELNRIEAAAGNNEAIAAELRGYWTRTDYLFTEVRNALDAIHRSLEGNYEYTPEAARAKATAVARKLITKEYVRPEIQPQDPYGEGGPPHGL